MLYGSVEGAALDGGQKHVAVGASAGGGLVMVPRSPDVELGINLRRSIGTVLIGVRFVLLSPPAEVNGVPPPASCPNQAPSLNADVE